MAIIDKLDRNFIAFTALIFGILGGLSVLLMAAGRHLPIDEYAKELLKIAANIQITHSLLGILAALNLHKLGIFGKISVWLCFFGALLFTIPVVLLALKIIIAAPSAPFGGICFAASWLFIGIGAFRYSFGRGQINDKA